MYRLLIVTDDSAIKERVGAIGEWERFNFKKPRIASNAEGAIDVLKAYSVDAVCAPEITENTALLSFMESERPAVPLFTLPETGEEQHEILKELYNLLTRLSADDSNDAVNRVTMLTQQRERWMHNVMSGMVPTKKQLERQLRLYRCRSHLGVPCVLTRLSISDADDFLFERWHYGSERLEVALRNFFGIEREGMRLHITILSPQEVRVLCYPTDEKTVLSENRVLTLVQETIDQVEHYLGMRMQVLEIRSLNGIEDFASERKA